MLILSGDHLYRQDYMDFVQVYICLCFWIGYWIWIPITFFEFGLVKSTMQIYVIILLDNGYRMWTILAVQSKFSGWKQYWWLSWNILWGWISLTFWICFWVMFFRSIRTVVLISQFHVCQWTTGNTFVQLLLQCLCRYVVIFLHLLYENCDEQAANCIGCKSLTLLWPLWP